MVVTKSHLLQGWQIISGGLECVGAGRYGVGIEISERYIDIVRDIKLAFQSVKRTLFLSLNSLHLRHWFKEFDLFRGAEGERTKVGSGFSVLSCM